MKSLARDLVALVVVAGAGTGIYLWVNSNRHTIDPYPVSQMSPSQPSAMPSDHYPVTAESDLPINSNSKRRPVPGIDESDQSVEEMLSELIGKVRFESLFNLKNIVRRIVVTVDNASKHNQISQEYSPFTPMERNFRVEEKNGKQFIDPSNFQRYQPYVELAHNVDAEGLVAIYVHFYPLFQTAYQDLGTRGYFNDRLIQAVDLLLGSPEIKGPIKVSRMSVHKIYKYADDQLEALSAAQKILIRMGTENALVIKSKLREIRKLLVHLNKTKSSNK